MGALLNIEHLCFLFPQWSLPPFYNWQMARGGRYVRCAVGLQWVLQLPIDYRFLPAHHLGGADIQVSSRGYY